MGRGPRLSAFQRKYFRAGRVHAGVLTLLSLVCYQYLGQTAFDNGWKLLARAVLAVGILAQSSGCFHHMLVGEEGHPSTGTLVTSVGAVLLVAAVLFLA